MSNEHNTDSKRQPANQAQPEKETRQDKFSKGYDTKSDGANQEKESKDKIAASTPGGEKPDNKRL